MVTSWSGGRHVVGLGAAVICGAVLAGCAGGPPEPAPVIMRGGEVGYSPAAMPAPYHPPRTALAGPRGEVRQIVVRPGQSLGGIAHEYRVSEHALVAANHLHPPYKIEAGQHLVIPVGGEPPLHEA
ncbi:MAG TPA: LysM peptidoglycan-binding domain-containing protein, partial [Stellaceae bacterium]|nr:LysM peptidoglycan-binding domain-containing protein [Stellaceae bacterium]